MPKLDAQRGWEFRTKHQLAAELIQWFVARVRLLGLKAKLWLVVDGAYAARPFLDPVRALGVVVVSRLRKDARLCDVPPARLPGQRGRPRIYGERSRHAQIPRGRGLRPEPVHIITHVQRAMP